jgi:hypothetical protein
MPSEVNSPTVRAGAYARYSSDNQSDASINDQIEVCRRYADLQGWEIVEVYPDRALSGASRFRPAFQQMEVDAEACRFDVIIVEALDPLSRKLADMKRRELQKIGVRLPLTFTNGFRRKPNATSPRSTARSSAPSGTRWIAKRIARCLARPLPTIALVTGHEVHPQACPCPGPGRPRGREV